MAESTRRAAKVVTPGQRGTTERARDFPGEASAFVSTALICVPLIAWRLGANPVLTFWVAYVLTRPIGASFADFFGMPKHISGMGYGHGPVSLVRLVLVLASFVYLSRSGIDLPEAEAPSQSRPPRRVLPEPQVRTSQDQGVYPIDVWAAYAHVRG
jgi:hypothetical protein